MPRVVRVKLFENLCEWGSRHYSIHYCKSSHLKEHDDIIKMQKEWNNDFQVALCATREELFKQLSSNINHLVETDFTHLINILYRLDISESRLKQSLQENTGKNAGELIAELVIERQLQKMKSREQFKSSGDIPDDEKWWIYSMFAAWTW